MKVDFWLDRWQENRIGFHQASVNQYLQDHWPQLGLTDNSTVFVPLCGKSIDMLWLKDQGHQVLGIELSEIAVNDFFRENDLEKTAQNDHPHFASCTTDGITLHIGDFFNLNRNDLKDIAAVYDRASLVALPPEMRQDYASHLGAILPIDISVLLVSMEYQQEEMQGPPFSVEESELRTLFQADFSISKLSESDVLKDNDNLKQRGLSKMLESVWLLTRR